MESKKASLVRQLTREEIFLRGSQIASALAKMATRRQAPKVSPEDYAVYVEDLLPYPLADVEAVCLEVGRTERKDGENAFPPIAILDRMLTEIARRRREGGLVDEVARWKAQWEADRAEDIANGIPRGEAQDELDAIVKPKSGRSSSHYSREQEEALVRMQQRLDARDVPAERGAC